MKISVKKVDALRREMHFEVPQERVTGKLDEILNNMVKHARIKGFRQGKAPRHLVAAAHADVAREEMMKNLIPEVYQEGLVQEKMDPIDFPAIDQVDLKDGGLKFRATFDLRPEVEVKDYKGVKVSKKGSEVSDDELNKSLDFFKKGRGLDETVPLDDEFAKGLGFPSLEDLKKAVKRNLELDKERQNRYEVETQLIDALIKSCKLDLPQSLVARQLEGRLEEFARKMKTFGMKEEDIAKKAEATKKELKEAAEKDVKTFLILHKIAEVEKIEAQKNENLSAKVMEFLLKEAKWEEAK
jgi:FKBP-type peptidyl-prolyl cis-trans isomerase (trigger factor)